MDDASVPKSIVQFDGFDSSEGEMCTGGIIVVCTTNSLSDLARIFTR